jgi:FkbM family methyltransferase
MRCEGRITAMNFVPDLIYDVGLHNGDDSAYYLARGFRVVAIEADPVQAEAARTRFAEPIAAGRLTLLNVAVAESEKTAQFWVNENGSQFNSFDRAAASRFGDPVHPITVTCERLDTVLARHGIPYYLKIDIEGHDIVCCEQLSPEKKPPFVSVEMWSLALLMRLRDLGYDRFKLVNQFTLRPFRPGKVKPRELFLRRIFKLANHQRQNRSFSRRLFRAGCSSVLGVASTLGLWGPPPPFQSRALPGWTFNDGSSGTFGDDLPDDWLPWQEVEALWYRENEQDQKFGIGFWCDIHATSSAHLGSS